MLLTNIKGLTNLLGLRKFPTYKQTESKDCGPTCIKIIAKYYNLVVDINYLRKVCETTREGSSVAGLCDGAEQIGFRPIAATTTIETLEVENLFPCIVHWDSFHFVVVYKISRKWVYVSDPAYGLIKYTKEEFVEYWTSSDGNFNYRNMEGVVIILYPTPDLHNNKIGQKNEKGSKRGIRTFLSYIKAYKSFFFQIILGLLVGSILQAITPFLTQSVVDIGIRNENINFVYLILFSQLLIFIGKSSVDLIQGWIALHLNTRINISLIADFFIKLMKLPISYFDVKMTGDILQRISDHSRIERLITNDTLNIIFSLLNLIVFSIILGIYSLTILLVSLLGNIIYLVWIFIFLKKRKEIDYKNFDVRSADNSKVIELINGMQEIKLHNAERKKRWDWEFIQAKRFKVAIEGLILSQIQGVGSSIINQSKDIFVSFLSAKLVIDGEITLGMMLSISFITGQVNAPISRLIGFINTLQDAKISLDRINEVYELDDEDSSMNIHRGIHELKGNIEFNEMSFKYPGTNSPVLSNLSCTIPFKKTTAIVGASGSGKTTLMKLLLKFYTPTSGEIKIDNYSLDILPSKLWRNKCGVVMQEGYIFNDTIAENIVVGEGEIDFQKLRHSIKLANLEEYISSLSLGLNTYIGLEGTSMSTGQKQRILIARAIYKDPQFIFFDEATSALDANNEKAIVENLDVFLNERTAVVIAHRLSTVKHADQILVLDKGKIVEIGNHNSLVQKRGYYYRLIKNQLELGA